MRQFVYPFTTLKRSEERMSPKAVLKLAKQLSGVSSEDPSVRGFVVGFPLPLDIHQPPGPLCEEILLLIAEMYRVGLEVPCMLVIRIHIH